MILGAYLTLPGFGPYLDAHRCAVAPARNEPRSSFGQERGGEGAPEALSPPPSAVLSGAPRRPLAVRLESPLES